MSDATHKPARPEHRPVYSLAHLGTVCERCGVFLAPVRDQWAPLPPPPGEPCPDCGDAA